MKYAAAIVAFAATAAVAQDDPFNAFPDCAVQDLKDAITGAGCGVNDLGCICADFSTIQTAATPPIIKDCGADVAINQVLPAAEKLCPSGGAPADSGSATPTPTDTAPADSSSATPTPTDAAPADSGSATPTPTDAAPADSSSAAATPSDSAPADSSATPAPTESAPADSSSAGATPTDSSSTLASVPTGTGAGGNGTTTPTPTNVPVNGAAALGSVGALAMLLLGALAL